MVCDKDMDTSNEFLVIRKTAHAVVDIVPKVSFIM